jgi:hypothetical protein
VRANQKHERRATWAWYLAGNSILSKVRQAQAEGEHTLAVRLSWLAVKSFPEGLREEVKHDLLFGPLPQSRRGLSVRAVRRKRCPLCEGDGVIVHPLMKDVYHRLDPEVAEEWEMDCPECGGTGRAMSSDISWDWPEDELE